MTIASSTRRAGPYACDGVDQTFDFTFKVFTASDVRVTLTDSTGVDTVITSYSVTLNADQDTTPGGFVTTVATYGVGNKITITGASVETQGSSIPNAGGFFPKVIENALDKLTILIQQLREDANRSFRASVSNPGIVDVEPAEANRLIGWNATGTGIENKSPTNFTVAPGISNAGQIPQVDAGGDFELVDVADAVEGSAFASIKMQGASPPAVQEGGLLRWVNVSGNTGVLGLPGGGLELDINLSADGSFTSHRNLLRVLDNWDYARTAPGIGVGFSNGGQPYACDTDWWFQSAQNIYFLSNNTKRLGAWAVATINAGAVNGLTLNLAGNGYNAAPTVTFSGGGGTGATATTTITAGPVPLYCITVTNGGSGYNASPTVNIAGGGGSGATAGAIVKAGVVTGVVLTNLGSGYTSAPAVSFTPVSGGSGAAATAYQARSVTGITLGVGGSGYTSVPYVIVGPGGNDALDAGPTMLLARDVANPMPTSACGNIGFVGRTTGALSVDAFYASIGGQVVDPNPLAPRGWAYISTADDPANNAGNTPRLYVGEGVFLSDALGQSSGQDLGPRTMNADVLAADRLFCGARGAGLPAGAFHSLEAVAASVQGDEVVRLAFRNGVHQASTFFAADNAGWNAAATALRLPANSVTSRSINAGGSINASGADYAEYMRKRPDCGVIEKGDICGIDNQGRLTDRWNRAHSFVVKSTDPAYVGGDAWAVPNKGERMTEEEVETRRQSVDRIAFSGQVPVNVLGATPGQFIVPIEGPGGTITGQASNTNPGNAVGKVWNVLGDGRAWVKVL